MVEDFNAVTDGTFILTETDVPNQFYFYRKDEGVLGDVDSKLMELYRAYTITKMMSSEKMEMVAHNLSTQRSTDGKCIKLTINETARGPIVQIDLDVSGESQKVVAKESWWQKAKRWLLRK